MSVASTTIDPSRRLDFYFRVKRDGTKKFIFLDADGGAIDISAYDFALYIKEYAGARTNIIAFTIGTGLEISGAGFNELTATFTVANTNVKEGQYYVELVKLSTNKTYLNGYAIAHNGVFDGVTVNTNDVTITDGADTVTIQITESGGVGSSIITGAQIEAALGYTPATGDDISTYVDQALTDFIEGQEGFPNSDQITDSIIADTDAVQRLAQAIQIFLTPTTVPPEIQGVPTISGTLTVPNVLTVTPAPVIGSGVTNTYQWERGGVAISGQTGLTYTLVDPTDFSASITVVQTATNSGGTDTAESAASSIGAAADITAPTITAASVTNITADGFTVNVTTDEQATHYYIVVAANSTTPTKAQIKAGVNYGAVTVLAAGNALGLSTNQNTSDAQVAGLDPETPHDVHKMAEDPAGNQSAIDTDEDVTTLAEASEIYVPIPVAPPFTDSVTIDAAVVGSSLEASELGGKREILIPATFAERLRLNGLVGTAASPFKFKSASDVTRSWIGGDIMAAGQQVIGTLGGSNHLKFYHLGLIGDSSNLVDGVSGVALGSHPTPGAFEEFVDIRIRNMGFAGMQINSATLDGLYNLIGKHICVDGHSREGEGLYLGSTSTSGHARFIDTLLEHIIITNKGRDGIQLNNHFNFTLRKVTIHTVGQTTVVSAVDQKNFLQIQNSTGLAEDGICWNAPRALNIFAHGVTIRNWQFYISAANPSYIGKASLSYAGSPQLTGDPLIIEGVHFGAAVPIANYITIAEDDVDIFFINCTKDSNVTNIFFDNRADKVTKTISEVGTTVAASVAPTFLALDITDEADHGCVTSSYHFDRGMGYRTKTPAASVVVAPTVQASSLVASNITDTSMTLTWTTSDGDVDLLLGKPSSAIVSGDLPLDDTNYAASNVFGSGSQIGDAFVVHKDSTNTVNITGLTPSTTYHWRVCAGNGSLANVKFLTTTATGNPISQATAAPAAFQPSDIAWDTFLDYSTAEADLAGGIWQNQGLDGDAIVALNSPTWDASKQMVRHVKTSNQRLTIQAANNYATPLWYIDVINTPTSFTGTQTPAGFSNTHRVYYNSAGLLHISGVSTGITLAVDTRYNIGVKFQGASSSYFIDDGAETPITLSTNAIGTPNFRVGSAFNNVDHYDGWRKYLFTKRGLTAQELSDMRDWLNNL